MSEPDTDTYALRGATVPEMPAPELPTVRPRRAAIARASG